MRTIIGVLAVGLCLALAPSASADEIVYFTSGTFLRVLAHEIQGDMVRVRLDSAAWMSFPLRMIDKIESAGNVVFRPGSDIQANQAIPPVTGLTGPGPTPTVTGHRAGRLPASSGGPSPRADEGMPPALTPMSGRAGEAQYLDGSVLGDIAAGPGGTRRVGNRYVVDPGPGGARGVPGPRAVRFGMKPGAGRGNPGTSQQGATPAQDLPAEEGVPPDEVPPGDDSASSDPEGGQ